MKEIALELRSPRWVAWGLILLLTGILWFRYPYGTYEGRGAMPPEYAATLQAWNQASQGGNPYAIQIGAGDGAHFKYSPGTLTFVGLMPKDPRTSWLVVGTLSLLLFAASLFVGSRYVGWKSVLLLFLGWALAWRGLLETLESGQLEILIFGLAAVSAVLLRRQPLLCGLIAGTLPWLKLPWILLLLPLILVNVPTLQGKGKKVRRVRLVFSGYLLAWLMWGTAIPSLVFGSERAMVLTGQWITALTAQPASLYLSRVNQSVWSATMRFFGEDPILGLGLGACVAGVILGLLMMKAVRMLPNRDVLAWLAPWLLVTQLLSPLSWKWGSVFALAAPFAIALTSDRAKSWRYPLLVAAVILAVLQIQPIAEIVTGQSWTAFHEYGAFTAFWAVLVLLSL